jgi:hypothetical protein
MATTLNKSGFEYAKQLINEGCFVADERNDWSEHQPSTEEENKFVQEQGMAEFGKGTSESMGSTISRPKGVTNFRTAILGTSTAAPSFPRRAEPINTSIMTWKMQRGTCTA